MVSSFRQTSCKLYYASSFIIPVTGLITAIFLLGKKPSTYSYIGGLIIILGVGMILINKKEKLKNLLKFSAIASKKIILKD